MQTQQQESEDNLICFLINYQIIDPVDSNPIGPRRISVLAKNWLDACDKVKFRYGISNVEKILVTHIFRRNYVDGTNEFVYICQGYIAF